MSEKKLAGLWIDTHKAILAKNHDSQEVSEFTVQSPIKAEIQHGNSNENAGNNAEQSNRLKFFKEIEKQITNSEELYITGPGQIQEELKRHLEDTAQYKNLKITLGTDQQLSDNQVLDTVKGFFKK